MRILSISTLLPYPLTNGIKHSLYYPLKYLAARGHEITLLCLADNPDPAALEHMRTFCRVEIHPGWPRRSMAGMLRSLPRSRSYDLTRFAIPSFRDHAVELATRTPFDVVEVALSTVWCGLGVKEQLGLPVVLRVHDVHWVNFERSIAQWKNPAVKLFLWNEARKIRREELAFSAAADLNLTISDTDADVLLRDDPGLVCRTIPAGIPLEPADGAAPVAEEPLSVLWMGSLGWTPNRDSFWWFYEKIVPELVRLVPDVRITVVGSDPPADILALQHPNVHVAGYVDDLTTALLRAQVCVVPLRIGSGIRLKLLEMFALRRAVVSTSVGCEGLKVRDGEHLLIADEPGAFAGAVARLLTAPDLRAHLGARGRTFVEESYDWRALTGQFEEAFASVIRRTDRSAGQQ